MSLEYNIRYPLSGNITEKDIKEAAREWIEESRWYKFTETNFPAEEKEGTLIQFGEGKTAWFKHFEFRKTEAGREVLYYGYRLETTDIENRKWRAEAVFELNDQQSWMYVNTGCYINNIQLPSKQLGGCRYPRIIRVILERGLLADDYLLKIGQTHRVSQLTMSEEEKLETVMEERSRLELPIICMHVRGSENWKERIEMETAKYLERTLHVYLCMDEADEKRWKKIIENCNWIKDTSSTGTEAGDSFFEILLPQSGICLRHDFKEKDTDYSLVDQVMDAIMRLAPFQPADSPDWNWLHMQNTVVPQDTDLESYNLIMNEALAVRLQEARRQHQMTQGELAKKTGTTTIMISRLERLQTKKVKRELIHDIEKALGLEKNELARLGTTKNDHTRKEEGRDPDRTEDGILNKTECISQFDSNSTKENTPAHFCHMCGTPLKPNSRFCHSCGERIE